MMLLTKINGNFGWIHLNNSILCFLKKQIIQSRKRRLGGSEMREGKLLEGSNGYEESSFKFDIVICRGPKK